MCGIVGIVGTSAVNQRLYDALTVLQHRGQDAAGIVTSSGEGELCVRKGSGLVRDVFQQQHMLELKGNVGIGHVRYPTAGCDSASEAQPFYVNAPYGICLGHNGNLTNAAELAEVLIREDRRHLNTTSDSEVLLNVFASELQRVGTPRVTPGGHVRGGQRASIAAAAAAMRSSPWSSATACSAFAIRTASARWCSASGARRAAPSGCWPPRASRSTCCRSDLVRDVAPGEAVFIDEQGRLHTQQCVATARHTPCIFEYVYFARPDSIIDNISVYRARMRMGERLADKILRERPIHDIDVVIPIPDTSRTSALQLAQRLGVKYREGFIKNRYIGRTFIMPGQEQREKSVRRKLNAIDLEFRGKNVLLVDDSIVRGTTSAQIIELAREAGAAKVYFASAAPPVRFPNVYGIDMPAAERAGRERPHRRGGGAPDRRRLAHLPGPRGPDRRLQARGCAHRGVRHLVLLRASTSPATSRPSISSGCSASARMPPSARAASAAARSRWCAGAERQRTPSTHAASCCSRCSQTGAAARRRPALVCARRSPRRAACGRRCGSAAVGKAAIAMALGAHDALGARHRRAP